MSEDQEIFPGAKSLKTGALVRISDTNGGILKRRDIKAVQLTYEEDDDDGKKVLVEVDGGDASEVVIASGNLGLLVKQLEAAMYTVETTTEAMLKVPGGKGYLEANGYLTEDMEADNVVVDPQASLEGAEAEVVAGEKVAKDKLEAKRKKNQAAQKKRDAKIAAQKAEEEAAQKAEEEAAQKAEEEAAQKAEEEAAAKQAEEEAAANGGEGSGSGSTKPEEEI